MPTVTAKCVAQAFDNQGKHLYYPGEVAQIDSAGPLAKLKTPTGKWVFDFPREIEKPVKVEAKGESAGANK